MTEEEYSDDGIICPYCKTAREPDCEGDDYTEGGFDEECRNCGKQYTVEPYVSYSWTATPDCDLNKEEHDFSGDIIENEYIDTDSVCRKCTKCGRIKSFKKQSLKC